MFMLKVNEIELILPYTGKFRFNKDNINSFFDIINSSDVEDDYLYCDINVILENKEQEEISENIIQEDSEKIYLTYVVPKNLVFTQKFQDRIKKEIPSVIEEVYPNQYIIEDFNYSEFDSDNMNLNLTVKINDSKQDSKYLDNDIGYIVEDIVNYYKK